MSFLFLEYDAVRPEKIMYFPVNIQAGILFSHKNKIAGLRFLLLFQKKEVLLLFVSSSCGDVLFL